MECIKSHGYFEASVEFKAGTRILLIYSKRVRMCIATVGRDVFLLTRCSSSKRSCFRHGFVMRCGRSNMVSFRTCSLRQDTTFDLDNKKTNHATSRRVSGCECSWMKLHQSGWAEFNYGPLDTDWQCDNYYQKSHKYMCIRIYLPDTKSNHYPNPTTKQHAIVNIQLNAVTCPTYPEKFQRDMLLHRLYYSLGCYSHTATQIWSFWSRPWQPIALLIPTKPSNTWKYTTQSTQTTKHYKHSNLPWSSRLLWD